MTLLILLLAGVMLSLGGCIRDEEPQERSLAVGDRVPAFSVTLSDGRVWNSRAPRSLPAVIVFFNTGCGDCRRELPKLQAAYEEHASEAEFICIAREEDEADIAKYWRENGLTLPYSPQPDRKIYNLFANTWIPRIYVVDPQGLITQSLK